MIFRIGQKVACITTWDEWIASMPCYIFPKIDEVYCIRGIREVSGDLYFLLREIVNKPCNCYNHTEEAAFAATGFRPLVSSEVQNEHVLRIIDRAKRQMARSRT